MRQRNAIIAAIITALIILIVLASFAPHRRIVIVSPLVLQSPDNTPSSYSYLPVIFCGTCPTALPTLIGITETPPPTDLPTLPGDGTVMR